MRSDLNLVKQFEEDLKRGECQEIEWKVKLDDPDKLAKEIAAFSTSNEGKIYIGVSKTGEIIGIPDITDINNASQKDDFLKRLRGIVSKVRPRVITRIDFLEYTDKVIAVINVEKGPKKVYYLKHIPYIRDNDESRPAEPEEIDKLYGIEEINYKELDRREVDQMAVHIFGYLKYPDPYELIQIINKYEEKYNKHKSIYIHMFNKEFNIIDYPLSDGQLKYILASYTHNKNNRYKEIIVYKKDSFKYYKDDINEILGNWNDYSRSEDSENLIYFLDNALNPCKATFVLKNNIFQKGYLELIETTIIYKDFTYFVEIIQSFLRRKEEKIGQI